MNIKTIEEFMELLYYIAEEVLKIK